MPSYATNPADWVKIAAVAFVSVMLVNYALDKIGRPSFKI